MKEPKIYFYYKCLLKTKEFFMLKNRITLEKAGK